jgi:hypothetical protein
VTELPHATLAAAKAGSATQRKRRCAFAAFRGIVVHVIARQRGGCAPRPPLVIGE